MGFYAMFAYVFPRAWSLTYMLFVFPFSCCIPHGTPLVEGVGLCGLWCFYLTLLMLYHKGPPLIGVGPCGSWCSLCFMYLIGDTAPEFDIMFWIIHLLWVTYRDIIRRLFLFFPLLFFLFAGTVVGIVCDYESMNSPVIDPC
ncbi:hypothetical protein BDV29DRAFT_59018 [Aspergillus leporis]|jgi:hypothetical protein|uniref:Uncharacterized protein n=1 Tax=Aspergillus leporis TaxID=41062 RepID=A0A5N5X9G4_9EURO|nr:hypothetical protein BDV29DRAFT_59018 [Aspergillus leporis]